MPFQHAVCLLLDKRIGEKTRLLQEFRSVNVPLQFFVAGDGSLALTYNHVDDGLLPEAGTYPAWLTRPNSRAAFLCFKQMLRTAQYECWPSVLLLEDDATVASPAAFRTVVRSAYQQMVAVDPLWEMLYMGANHKFARTERVGPDLLRVNGSGCFHAVVVRSNAYQAVLDLPLENPIDGVVAKRLHPSGHCYSCSPSVVTTVPGYSYCEGRDVDYTEFFG